jgi:DNA modification methylase
MSAKPKTQSAPADAAAIKVKRVPIDSVHLDPANVRRHPERNLAAISASLARFGQVKPIVIDGKGIVRAGNGTLEAARALGWKDIEVTQTGLEGSEATAFAIADNRTAELAEWDSTGLAETLRALQSEDFDLAAVGYSSDDVDELLKTLADDVLDNGAPPEDPGPQIDRADELQAKWQVKPGDLWVIPSKTTQGEHRILCGNSTKADDVTRVCDGQVQMCVTSPPYWSLRDYGTATWEGGDPECDHKDAPKGGPHTASTLGPNRDGLGPNKAAWAESKREQQFRDTCGKCGARRIDSQLGLEATPEAFVAAMTGVFAEVKRVLRDDGTCWVNLGDSYAGGGKGNYGSGISTHNGTVSKHCNGSDFPVPAGLKPKDLVGIPWRCAFALQADGWYLRMDIIWHKPNPMPESVTDRPTKSHEYIFLMAKQERYFFDSEAVREAHEPATIERCKYGGTAAGAVGRQDALGKVASGGWAASGATRQLNPAGRNTRSVWTITPQPFAEAHFATFPVELAARCIEAGTSERGACPTCGAPWERVTEPTGRLIQQHWAPATQEAIYSSEGHNKKPSTNSVLDTGFIREKATLGWRPTCSHDAEPQPCTVFDPFLGAATTIVACEQLGRLGRGIELSPAYVAIALERLAGMGLEPRQS